MNNLIDNLNVLNWINEVTSLTNPKEIVIIDGSKDQLDKLTIEACNTGELLELNQEKLPGCYYHRSDKDDVARMEDRTFICTENELDAGPTNNWKSPKDAYDLGKKIFKNSMKDRTMYVIPYCMGPLQSPYSKVGIEITDSIYVVLNMNIMSRVGKPALEKLGKDSNDFVRGLHGKCDLEKENRYIFHFQDDKTIWSCNSAYGGNALLGKKCFALRIAGFMGKQNYWMAEHMLILGIENPKGEVKYIAAAFPSACGKTNLAMMIPPEFYRNKGYKIWTIGDDIAWIRIGEDGQMYALNPEAGFFGVAPGTGLKSNPNAMVTASKNTIFTNVALNLDDNTVWWEGISKTPPTKNMLNWKGEAWNNEISTEKGAHPNSRFTSPIANCPSASIDIEKPHGVPISAIIFGGRRAKTAPLVYEARSWNHGVFIGSSMASETTSAATGQVGVVRRDPMAMLPFCGYNMADYFKHWIDMGAKASNPPKIFNVNWFKTDDKGSFLWPGYGENYRVLEWILNRCEGNLDANEDAIGFVPKPEDINAFGLDITEDNLRSLFDVDKDLWRDEVKGIEEFYNMFEDRLPIELAIELNDLKERLK